MAAAIACGRLNADLHAGHIALAVRTAVTVDEAEDAGQQGYAAAVLGKHLAALGLEVKQTDRWLRGATPGELKRLAELTEQSVSPLRAVGS